MSKLIFVLHLILVLMGCDENPTGRTISGRCGYFEEACCESGLIYITRGWD